MPDKRMCDIGWCMAYAKPDNRYCTVHATNPGYTPKAGRGGTALKKDPLRREQRNIAIREADNQAGARESENKTR